LACRIGAAQDGINVCDAGGLGNAVCPRGAGGSRGIGRKGVAFDFEAVTAFLGYLVELREYPVGGGLDAGAGGQVLFHAGERIAGLETNQLLDRLMYASRVDGGDRPLDCRIGTSRRHGMTIEGEVGLARRKRRREDGCAKQEEWGNLHEGTLHNEVLGFRLCLPLT